MSRPRLVVHLGTEGTGTRSLAKYLGVNRRALYAGGVYFHPVIRPPHRLADFGSAPTLLQLRRARSDRAQNLAADLASLATLCEVNAVGVPVTVMTARDMLWCSETDIRLFERRFADFDIEPLIVLRRFPDLADSRYSALVVESGWTDEPPANLIDDDLPGRIALWAETAASGHVTSIDYDAMPDGDVIKAFLVAARIDTAGLSPPTLTERSPCSLSPMFVALIRTFRQQGVAEEHLRGLVQQFRAFRAAEPQTNLPDSMHEHLQREYCSFWAELHEAAAVQPGPGVAAGAVSGLGERPLRIANLSDAVFALGRAVAAAGRRSEEVPGPSAAALWQRIAFLEDEIESAAARAAPASMTEGHGAGRPRAVDFVVAGAQKAGTTALWEFLRRHPGVYMPSSKETRFFQFDEYYGRGREWFEAEYFTVTDGLVCGMATPHVMGGTTDATPEEIARRLREYSPDLKLVVLLRDPIERAASHHRMMVKRGEEQRTLEQAVSEQLPLAALEDGRRQATETNSYVARGEYGRILADLLRHFPKQQILVAWAEELADRPREVTERIAEFVGVAPAQLPEVGGSVFVGGTSARVDFAAAVELRAYLADRVWPHVSQIRREDFEFFFEMWNTVPDDVPPDISVATREVLAEHFRPDGKILLDQLGLQAPWLARWAVGP